MAIPKWKELSRGKEGYRDSDDEESEEERDTLASRQPFYNLKFDKLSTFRPRAAVALPYKIALGLSTVVILILTYMLMNRGPHALVERVSYKTLDYSQGPLDGDGKEPAPQKAIVLASYRGQNVEWTKFIDESWKTYRYILDDDDPFSSLSVPRNKGREGMAYLTYIIDHYYNLPEYIMFIHGHDKAWHQLAPTQWKIAALNMTALDEQSYINLRCGHNPGCTPETLNGAKYPTPADTPIDGEIMPLFWRLMFPNDTSWGQEAGEFPDAVGQPCCAQFAVTRDAITRRPIEFWKGFRNPMTRDITENRKQLGDPWLTSHRMGTYYEKVWHVAFGKNAMNCPPEEICRGQFFQGKIHCEHDTGRFKNSHNWKQIKCNTSLPQFNPQMRNNPRGLNQRDVSEMFATP